jgi:hypothetical protein
MSEALESAVTFEQMAGLIAFLVLPPSTQMQLLETANATAFFNL